MFVPLEVMFGERAGASQRPVFMKSCKYGM